jgi:hypothetical protein
MSEIERLRQIIDTLPPQQVHALLTLLAPHSPVSHDEFLRLLSEAPEEDVDDETAARILSSNGERGETISHDELKHRLGFCNET